MNGIDYFKKALNQYADIKGRARRSEYWYFVLFMYLGYFALLIPIAISETLAIAAIIWMFALIVPGFCVGVRRLHDTGKSGTYLLFSLIPFVGSIILLVFMCSDSEPGPNKWGPNPKEVDGSYADVSQHLI